MENQNQNLNHFDQGGEITPNIQTPVNDYLILNIIASIIGIVSCNFCCIASIIGIVGIVFSVLSKNNFGKGDFVGAEKNAKIAKILMIISFGISAITLVLVLISIITGGFALAFQEVQQKMQDLGY